jgi:hypothetical protein
MYIYIYLFIYINVPRQQRIFVLLSLANYQIIWRAAGRRHLMLLAHIEYRNITLHIIIAWGAVYNKHTSDNEQC